MNTYTLTVTFRVFDPAALWDAAACGLREGGVKDSELSEYIGPRDSPNIGQCLIALGDPGESFDGTEILSSDCEGPTP
jgi:hypothetical protein